MCLYGSVSVYESVWMYLLVSELMFVLKFVLVWK